MYARIKQKRQDGERGAILLEFAIALLIFIPLLMLIFDAGLGFAASRSSSSAARSAARVGALAGDNRAADFRVLDAIRAKYPDGGGVQQVTIYRSLPDTDGSVPSGCEFDGGPGSSIANVCNVYSGAILATLAESDFASIPDPADSERMICDASAIDIAWCPTNRRANDGQYLGVAIWIEQDAAVGLGASTFDLQDRAVFSLYFPPIPVAAGP